MADDPKPSPPSPPVTPSTWEIWRGATPARLALGRAGSGMPTNETLRFGWAHAQARDAVHAPLDVPALVAELEAGGWPALAAHSRAADRAEYLRRPDFGRRLANASRQALEQATATQPRSGFCCVVGDGLSALAVARHAVPLLRALRPLLPVDLPLLPVVVAQQARVALADEVGEIFGARIAVMLIGERPGLSSPDSLGIYLTHAPRVGRTDAERNCISNVRPEGLPPAAAAQRLAWLVREALARSLTGVALKDDSGDGSAALPG